MKANVSTRLDVDLIEALKTIAAQQHRTLSNVVEVAVSDWYKARATTLKPKGE